MVKLLVNNIEQNQPDHRNDTVIKLYGRSPQNPSERVPVKAFGFDPYFYVREAEAEPQEDFLLEQDCIREIECGDHESLSGDSLAKIYPPYPQDTRNARELFDDTWEADVPFTRRFLIDTGIRAYIEVPDSCEEPDGYECHCSEITALQPPGRATPGA